MLIGIVKKNAIMMIDFALEAQRARQEPAAEAIYQGCLLRFRPDHDDDHGGADGHAARSPSASAPAPSRAARSGWPWWAASCSRSS